MWPRREDTRSRTNTRHEPKPTFSKGRTRVQGMRRPSSTFDDWVSDFSEWQHRVGFDPAWIGDFDLSIKFDWDRAGDTIEFGDFQGRKKWERALQVPHQNIRGRAHLDDHGSG